MSTPPLSLPEELLLLALDDATGTTEHEGVSVANLSIVLNAALLAAALMDLVLRERIVRRPPGPLPADDPADHSRFWHTGYTYYLPPKATATGHGYLDHVLGCIAMHPLGDRLHRFDMLTVLYRGITTAMTPRVYSSPPDQRLLAAQDLIQRDVLGVEQDRLLWGLHQRTRLPETSRATGEDTVRERLRSVVLASADVPEERTRALLLLIRDCGMLDNLFGRENHDKADWRIAQLLRLNTQTDSMLADVHRYLVAGVSEYDLVSLSSSSPPVVPHYRP